MDKKIGDQKLNVIIVGGVAAGASAAARLRRLNESCRILLLEKGECISYANCGLPYHLGGVIPERDDLLVMSSEKFSAWLNVDVRTRTEVTAIDRTKKLVFLRTPDGMTTEPYDKLLLATGATPAGAGKTGGRLLNLWTLSDMDRVCLRLKEAKKVVIAGAGFIGLETAENLRKRGIAVTLIQRGDHVLPSLDREMAGVLSDELFSLGVDLRLGTTVEKFEEDEESVSVRLSDGETLRADFMIECTGVRPNTSLAENAGLALGPKGHILVNEFLETSDPDIYAAGDAIEVRDPVFGGKTAVPLAGPANKQGRIAAGNMLGGRTAYPGSFGTSVVKVGRLTAASVGYTEKRLAAAGTPYRKIYLHPSSGASYYPGASRLSMKLLFGNDGTIFGAQITGTKGADKRIDTIAQAMRNGLKAPELGTLELAYAPPFSSAKDPVNFAGFIAENVLSGLSDVVYPDSIPEDARILDVREPEEFALGAIPGAVNIPLGELRSRLSELDKAVRTVCYCQVGLRGYLAERILKQNGFEAANLSGGWTAWKMFHPSSAKKMPPVSEAPDAAPAGPVSAVSASMTLDVSRLSCPGPVLKLKKALESAPEGTVLHLKAARGFEPDLLNWAKGAGCTVGPRSYAENELEADVVKGSPASVSSPAGTPASGPAAPRSAAIVLFSNDLDKAMAALILANGFAAAGMKTSVFFTFWGLSVLRKDPAPFVRKNLVSKMFGFMLPRGARELALSKMNMLGMGSAMMKSVMKKQNVLSLPELIRSAREAGVRFIACDMAMNVMGITREELIEVDEVAGVATFAGLAGENGPTLFI